MPHQPTPIPNAPLHVRIHDGTPARRSWRLALCAVAAFGAPQLTRAQQVDSTPHLGISASGALRFHAGIGQFKHSTLGPEVGGALDIGWLGSRRVRLSVGIDYLSTTIDRPDSLGISERGPAYVFTGFADVTWLPALSHRLSPYVGLGFGVDAVGTSISNEQVGFLYNTNVFDVHAQVGGMFRLTRNGRLTAEIRGTEARVVRRYGVRLGYVWLFNGLRDY